MNPDFWMRVAVGVSHAWFYEEPVSVSRDRIEPPKPRVVVASPLDTVSRKGSFAENGEITVAPENGSVLGFVADGNDGLIAITGVNHRYGSRSTISRGQAIPNRLVWLDPQGTEKRYVELDCAPRGLARAADGTVYVVGDTIVAWYSPSGEMVGQKDAPQFALPEGDREQFHEEIVDRRDLSVEQQMRSLQQREEALHAMEQKENRDSTDEARIKSLAQQIEAQRKSIEFLQKKTPEELFVETVARAKQLHRVAVSNDHVFLVSNEATGYGYAVWRCDRECEKPVKIIGGLRGCCGQMDLQAAGEKLMIAENTRHRVLITDFEGATVTAFGKRDAKDVENGFGGCCNPMNTCVTPGGGVLTSESNGLIKRYAIDGTFQEVVGVADVASGCKNSSVGISADGKTVYFLDVTKGRVVRLERREGDPDGRS